MRAYIWRIFYPLLHGNLREYILRSTFSGVSLELDDQGAEHIELSCILQLTYTTVLYHTVYILVIVLFAYVRAVHLFLNGFIVA